MDCRLTINKLPALVAFYDFTPECIFKCVLKLLASADA